MSATDPLREALDERAVETTFLVCVERRYNSTKLRDVWFWEVVDAEGRILRDRPRGLGHGVFPFGWARSEASAYRQARRMKQRLVLAATPASSSGESATPSPEAIEAAARAMTGYTDDASLADAARVVAAYHDALPVAASAESGPLREALVRLANPTHVAQTEEGALLQIEVAHIAAAALAAVPAEPEADRSLIAALIKASPNYGSEHCICGSYGTPARECPVHWALWEAERQCADPEPRPQDD